MKPKTAVRLDGLLARTQGTVRGLHTNIQHLNEQIAWCKDHGCGSLAVAYKVGIADCESRLAVLEPILADLGALLED